MKVLKLEECLAVSGSVTTLECFETVGSLLGGMMVLPIAIMAEFSEVKMSFGMRPDFFVTTGTSDKIINFGVSSGKYMANSIFYGVSSFLTFW